MLRAAALMLVVGAAACDDETGLVDNPDLGPRIQIPLEVGDTFTYRAQLTRKESSNRERQASFRLTVEIVSIDDNLDREPTVLGLVASGENLPAGNDEPWQSFVDDFDTWVGRMGPTLPSESVPSAPVDVTLADAPPSPPAPQPMANKPLPQLGAFFIDVRRLPAVRADWVDREPDATVDSTGDEIVFTSMGPDGLAFHDTDNRILELRYDPDGFLTRIQETLGPGPGGFDGTEAQTTTRLTLESSE